MSHLVDSTSKVLIQHHLESGFEIETYASPRFACLMLAQRAVMTSTDPEKAISDLRESMNELLDNLQRDYGKAPKEGVAHD